MLIQFRLLALALTACLLLSGCGTWQNYRHDVNRSGNQPWSSLLSDPSAVEIHQVAGPRGIVNFGLGVGWRWPSTGTEGGSFKASPIVFKGRVFIGSSSGNFYALDANTGSQVWQFPGPGGTPLVGSCGYGAYGIQSSAAYARINGQDAVIFGAPDPDPATDSGLGSARLWALNSVTGSLIWKSDVVAQVTGCTPRNENELHERIAYSSPLVANGMVYVGVHDNGDNPIMNGKVVAIDLAGHKVPSFNYVSTYTPGVVTRGGGVWNSPAMDNKGIYFTTGNTRTYDGPSSPQPEPTINNGLSLMRVDPATGAVVWRFQPVPYPLDLDPDWAAGAAVVFSSCGDLITSVQKDGWTYAVNASDGSCKWQYPPTGNPAPSCTFSNPLDTRHGDFDYKQPGAVWGEVVIIKAGGWGVDFLGGEGAGYRKLHALNACGPDSQRVRWISDIPDTTLGAWNSMGAPTVTGGIVYVTTDQGYVVAIADITLRSPVGYQCTNEFINPTSAGLAWVVSCGLFGFQLVPTPQVLREVPLDGSSAVGLRNEPVIADGKLFVGTTGGHVFSLWPRTLP